MKDADKSGLIAAAFGQAKPVLFHFATLPISKLSNNGFRKQIDKARFSRSIGMSNCVEFECLLRQVDVDIRPLLTVQIMNGHCQPFTADSLNKYIILGFDPFHLDFDVFIMQ